MNKQENFATTGFIEKMTDKNFGTYVILGSTGSGRSTLLLKYLDMVPEMVKSVLQAEPSEYSKERRFSNLVPTEVDIVKLAQQRRSAVIASDKSHTTQDIQDLLMLSTMANVALTLHGDSISSFLLRIIGDPDFYYGKRTMLEKVKGVTFTKSVVLSNGLRANLQESLFLNSENVEKFIQTEATALHNLIQSEIVCQGAATIEHQTAALEATL